MDKFPLLSLVVQITLALLSLLCLRKYNSKFYYFLVLILVTTAVVESVGAYLTKAKKPGIIVYIIYAFILFNSLALLYNQLIRGKVWKIVVFSLVILFNVFWLFVLYKKSLFYYLIILGSFNTSVFSFFYLRNLLLSNEILNYRKLLSFWVTVGFLVFYLPSIPFFINWKYMNDRGLFFIISFLGIIMNFFIAYGLLCSNRETKY